MTDAATHPPASLETEAVRVRDLRPSDLDAVVKIDALRSGRSRGEYFVHKLQEAQESTPRISLAAEVDGHLVGFLLGRLYYGEFGLPEPTAVIDSIGVHPEHGAQGVGQALFEQLQRNMRSLGVEYLRTEVEWKAHDLLRFLAKQGFEPAPRLCLELRLEPTP